MGKLADKQARFTKAFCEFAYHNNPVVVDGVLYRMRMHSMNYCARPPEENQRIGGPPSSTHLHRLAVDIIVDRSTDDGKTWKVAEGDDPVWHMLHERWEMDYGGSSIIRGDAGHFSFEHNGVR